MSVDDTERSPLSARSVSFIVRVSWDEAGHMTGIVEWVRTGSKERVHNVEAIGQAIARMLSAPEPDETGSGMRGAPRRER
jgi:hypothetical protein